MNALYDRIGKSYSQTRRADPRISKKLQELLALPSGSRILDIGAGTGNYSLELATSGFQVLAVEPSSLMRAQVSAHDRITWIASSAERIPLEDNVADGAIVVLAFHHFVDQKKSIEEICRIVGKGPIVIFSWDVQLLTRFWLADYFPGIYPSPKDIAADVQRAAKNIFAWTKRKCEIFEFPLPCDLVDYFAAANWARPEAYLNEEVRQGISSFSEMSPKLYLSGLEALERDLLTGKWDKHYGSLRSQKEYDVGYRFLKIIQS